MTDHTRALLEQALEALDNIPHPPWRDKELADAIRAELAKPVERVEPITLDQFRAIANRTATTYRHRSDPEKSSYAFVDGSSLDDFWRKVCEAIQPTPAWHDAPTEPGIWLCDEGGPDCYTYTAHNIVLLNDPALKDDECRWYGPIPQGGAKAEGGAA